MTRTQLYIIVIILSLGLIFFLNKKHTPQSTPPSIGDPLELVVVQNQNIFQDNFHKKIIDLLTLDIGPAPQSEKLLNIIGIDAKKFTGILKRHQNLLLINKSDKFKISVKKNLFARNQTVIILECPSYESLYRYESEISSIPLIIKKTEIERLVRGYKKNVNTNLRNLIQETHGLSIFPPKGFFLAYRDSSTIWIRRETSKISQGVFIANFSNNTYSNLYSTQIKSKIDSLIRPHISSAIEGSYMILDNNAPYQFDSLKYKNGYLVRLQSLWKMANDFMGGIYLSYFYIDPENSQPCIIYSYLYAPGEKKNVPLIQLEALVSTVY